MSRLAYIFYIYIKANTHQTSSKLTKAIEEIQNVRKNLPLHLSHRFPANADDKQWELEHPWVPFQRYLVTHVLDFLELGIARVLVSRETEDDPSRFRKLATTLATRILQNYAISVPRLYRLVWTVSAAAVAAALYISLDLLANPQDYRGNAKAEAVELLRYASVELRRHADVAVHAAKGSALIERLMPLVTQDHAMVAHPQSTVQDLVQQLSASDKTTASDSFYLSLHDTDAIDFGSFELDHVLGQADLGFQDPVGTHGWDEFLLGL
jgi:hypothetical protein